MDDLDRLHDRLLVALRDGAPHLRDRRFRLGDIPMQLVPYRLHRRELGFESAQQYERALARLAAGERGYLTAEGPVRDAFRRAAADPGAAVDQLVRLYADSPVALAPGGAAERAAAERAAAERAAAERATAEMPVPEPDAPAAGARDPIVHPVVDPVEIPIVRVNAAADAPAPPDPSDAAPPAMPFPVRPPAPVAGGGCPHCGRPLPADRAVTFCPYCGENLTVRRCPACSTELDAGWRFCITCGREVDDPAAVPGP